MAAARKLNPITFWCLFSKLMFSIPLSTSSPQLTMAITFISLILWPTFCCCVIWVFVWERAVERAVDNRGNWCQYRFLGVLSAVSTISSSRLKSLRYTSSLSRHNSTPPSLSFWRNSKSVSCFDLPGWLRLESWFPSFCYAFSLFWCILFRLPTRPVIQSGHHLSQYNYRAFFVAGSRLVSSPL